jgi:hypothetical protein
LAARYGVLLDEETTMVECFWHKAHGVWVLGHMFHGMMKMMKSRVTCKYICVISPPIPVDVSCISMHIHDKIYIHAS